MELRAPLSVHYDKNKINHIKSSRIEWARLVCSKHLCATLVRQHVNNPKHPLMLAIHG